MLAVSAAQELWITAKEQGEPLWLTASIRTPSADPVSPIMEFRGNAPGLIFHEGSLTFDLSPFVADLGLWALVLGAYGVALWQKSGVFGATQVEKLVRKMREVKVQRLKLPRLDELTEEERKELKNKKGLILLLHGLFSTDIGTFDGLIQKWDEQAKEPKNFLATEGWKQRWRGFKQRSGEPDDKSSLEPRSDDFIAAIQETLSHDFMVLGWPHNTFIGIDPNAVELAMHISEVVGLDGPPIVFVCHSRGGLVARQTAVYLYDLNPKWAEKLCGCVTFGTPHEGAALAEAGPMLRLMAAFVIIMSKFKNATPIAQVLAYWRQCGFNGIDDLVPIDAEGEFLNELRKSELKQAPNGQRRWLEILRVGGRYRSHGGSSLEYILNRVVSGLLGTEEHDLVVACTSSMPGGFGENLSTECGHTEYFESGETGKPHFQRVITYLREKLKLDEAVMARVEITFSPDVVPGPGYVAIGGLRIPANDGRPPTPLDDET